MPTDCAPCREWRSGKGRCAQPPAWMSYWGLQTFLTGSCGSVACDCSSRRPSHLLRQEAHIALHATLQSPTAWRYLKVRCLKHKVHVSLCVETVMNFECLPFSHRWRMAADSVHAEGNVRWCGQGARHWPVNVLQATLCVRSQVRFTWHPNLNIIHQAQWHSNWQYISAVVSVISTCLQSCWIDLGVKTDVETTSIFDLRGFIEEKHFVFNMIQQIFYISVPNYL